MTMSLKPFFNWRRNIFKLFLMVTTAPLQAKDPDPVSIFNHPLKAKVAALVSEEAEAWVANHPSHKLSQKEIEDRRTAAISAAQSAILLIPSNMQTPDVAAWYVSSLKHIIRSRRRGQIFSKRYDLETTALFGKQLQRKVNLNFPLLSKYYPGIPDTRKFYEGMTNRTQRIVGLLKEKLSRSNLSWTEQSVSKEQKAFFDQTPVQHLKKWALHQRTVSIESTFLLSEMSTRERF